MLYNSLDEIIKGGSTPIGVGEDEKYYGLSSAEHSGIVHLFGRSGQGRIVLLKSIIVSEINNDQAGLVIDPYGDMLNDAKTYIPAEKQDNVLLFEVQSGTADENLIRFKDMAETAGLQNDGTILCLCNLDYRTLGKEEAGQLGREIVRYYLQTVSGNKQSLILDDAHMFIDDEILGMVIDKGVKGLFGLLSDQGSMDYRTDVLEKSLAAANHIICYNTSKETAELINKHHTEIDPEAVMQLEKYYFLMKSNAKSDNPEVLKLKGFYPVPYPQVK